MNNFELQHLLTKAGDTPSPRLRMLIVRPLWEMHQLELSRPENSVLKRCCRIMYLDCLARLDADELERFLNDCR